MQCDVPSEYQGVVSWLLKPLANLPGYVIAIDGRNGSGKTTLGRFLACHFNIALLETDHFRYDGPTPFSYFDDHIARIIDERLAIPRPVIVEGVRVLDLLARNGIAANCHIYVEGDAPVERGEEFEYLLAEYEERTNARSKANIVVLVRNA